MDADTAYGNRISIRQLGRVYTAIKHGLSTVLFSLSLGQDMQDGTNILETMGF